MQKQILKVFAATALLTAAIVSLAPITQAQNSSQCARKAYEWAIRNHWGYRPSPVGDANEAAFLLGKALQRGNYSEAQKRASQYVVIRVENGAWIGDAYDEVDRIERRHNSAAEYNDIYLTVQSQLKCGYPEAYDGKIN